MERVQLNGADIEYDVRGSGAPVVFIHGAILSDGFVPVIEQTGIAENFQIVHYRRRGYAGSSRALAGMTMQGWAGDCIALLNHLGIASAHVAGHSFGAGIALQMAIDAPGRVRKLALLEPPLLSLVPSGGPFTEWVASVREIYDSGDKTAATDIILAGAYGQEYRRFTDGALPAGAFDRAVSDIDTFFQVELGAMQRWNITTEGLKDIRHPVLSMRGSDTLPVFFEGADLLQQLYPAPETLGFVPMLGTPTETRICSPTWLCGGWMKPSTGGTAEQWWCASAWTATGSPGARTARWSCRRPGRGAEFPGCCRSSAPLSRSASAPSPRTSTNRPLPR